MKFKLTSSLGTCSFLLLLPLMPGIDLARAASTAAIFHWVAAEMAIADPGELPKIRFVGREELTAILRENTQSIHQRWRAEYGVEQADEFLRLYMAQVVGLFHPQTWVIYIGDFLSPCRQQAVLAHELTHYFQLVTRGAQGAGAAGSDLVFLRELEARKVERRFTARYCLLLVP